MLLIYSKTSLSGTLLAGPEFYSIIFIVMKTSLSGTLFSVPKPKMKLTKWDTLLFETYPSDVFITFQGKSGFVLQKLGIIKPVGLINLNQEESVKECEEEEENEGTTLSKAVVMADKLKRT